jgi:crotonobetainyl-CoA:carnitine CoA-transferase CaiB-like acyl-CoA transferase
VLEGLKIVELATYIAAPSAAGLLADWGAEVVKVEPPAGDPSRRSLADFLPPGSGAPMFELDNRGKQAVVLDITRPEGREALGRLLAAADVFLTNVRPGALKRAGLDFETLHALHPAMIYASVTGYGLTGPGADLPGFDGAVFWARAGVGALTAPKGSDPFPIRTGMGDHVTGLGLVAAILAAVVERTRTGQGRLVEASLLRAGVYAIGSDMAVQLRLGRLASTRPRQEAIEPLSNFYQSSDGRWILVMPRNDFHKLAEAIERPELPTDPRFDHGRRRAQNSRDLVEALDEAFSRLTFEEISRRLDAADIIWSPVQRPADVAADPLAEAAGCFVDQLDGEGGTVRLPAGPVRFSGAEEGPKPSAPKLGEHTRSVLAAVGYSDAEIEALIASGAAG